MKYSNPSTVFSYGNTKTAALYSNYVVPFDFINGFESGEVIKVLDEILPPELNLDENAPFHELMKNEILYLLNATSESGKTSQEKHLQRISESAAKVKEVVKGGIEGIGFPDDVTLSETDHDITCLLMDFPMVNVEGVSWKHLLEFRKDRESVYALKDLRTFIFDDYQDKPKAYVIDSIDSKMREHERSIKKWGLGTILSTLEIFISPESVKVGAVAAVSQMLAGIPLTEAIATGAVVNVGSAAIKFGREAQRLSEKQQNTSGVTYLVNAAKLPGALRIVR